MEKINFKSSFSHSKIKSILKVKNNYLLKKDYMQPVRPV